jgi:hypothetical protein
MLLPITLVCDRRVRKDRTNPICIQYCYRPDKRTILNTEIYVTIRFQNQKLSRISKELPDNFGNLIDIVMPRFLQYELGGSLLNLRS